MAAMFQMTWREKGKRWVKKQSGKQYAVSCRQLWQSHPDLIESETKRGSYKAANQWWQEKEAELEAEARAAEPALEELVKKAKKERLDTREKEIFHEELERRLSKASSILEAAGLPDSLGEMNKRQMELVTAAANLALNNEISETDIDNTRAISTLIDKWLAKRERLSKTTGKPDITSVRQNKAHLATLKNYISETDIIDEINSAWLADFRDILIDKVEDGDLREKSAINILGSVSQFVDWLALERELIARPNLMSKRGWKQLTYDPKAYPMSVETWRKAYKKADDLTKLYLLLMANTGFTAKDIADIKPEEVNWTKGRIKRRRSKGKNYKNAPIVDRILWPETLDLLKRFGHRKGEKVLLSEAGTPLVSENRKDLVGQRVKDVIEGFGPHYRPKDIRSGCATLIDANRKYRGWETYFLGQSPQGVAAKHYVGENADKQAEFDELTMWLGTKWLPEK